MPTIILGLEDMKRFEQAEVVLTNLLMLQHPTEKKFIISHDDIVVSIEAAIGLIHSTLTIERN